MKCSGNMWLMKTLKVTKNQGFTLSLEDTFFKKSQGEKGGQSYCPPAVLGLKTFSRRTFFDSVSWRIFLSTAFMNNNGTSFKIVRVIFLIRSKILKYCLKHFDRFYPWNILQITFEILENFIKRKFHKLKLIKAKLTKRILLVVVHSYSNYMITLKPFLSEL